MDDQIGGAAPPVATLVSAAGADARAWSPLEPYSGVDYKLLWRSGKSVAGLMRIAPGGEVTPHAHLLAHHHLWVVDGEVELLHDRVGPGTYVHIPAHVDHALRGAGPGACTLLYLYLRDDSGG